MRVDIEDILDAQSVLDAVNKVALAHLELYEGGERITITPEKIEWWRYVGLNNAWFITSQEYKRERS